MQDNVLAIDPGTSNSAYVVWDGKTILAKGKVSNADMLDITRRWKPGRVAIERIASYGMPVGEEIFTTVLWAGRFLEAASVGGSSVTLIYRRQVKMHLCGTATAKDGNIRQRLIDLLGAPGTKKAPGVTYGVSSDIWAALAVAVTYWELYR